MWPVMVFYTSSAIHMLAHSAWAQTMMLAGGAQLGLVRGKLRSPLWELTLPFALLVSGLAFLIHEQNPWLFSRAAFLHHALGWTVLVGALICLGRALRPRSPRLQRGVRDDHDHRLRLPALLRPERRADLRPPVPARRRAMRAKALAAAVLVALALPASALAHANLLERMPTYGVAARQAPPNGCRSSSTRASTSSSNSIDVRSATGKDVTAGPAHTTDSGRSGIVPLRKLPKGAYTVRWHITSNEGHVISGVYTFGVRVKPPPPTEAYGAGGPTKSEYIAKWGYFLGLALLVGGLAFRLLVLARAHRHPAVERRFYWVDRGRVVVGSIELGILGFMLRAADAFQLPLGQARSTETCRRSRSGTRFGTAFIAMTLGFALVAAFLFLAWLTDRTDPALARVLPRARALLRALAVGALGRRRRVVVEVGDSPTACTSSRRASGSAGS